jgi:hypothetical protein
MIRWRALVLAEALRDGHSVELRAGGSSMLPLLRAGDLLTIEPADAGALKRNDIAVFARDGGLVAHRVLSTAPLVTRGDGCASSDGVVPRSAVLGRVCAFERHGVRVRLDRSLGRALSWLSRLVGALLARRYAVPAPGLSVSAST